LVIRFFIFSCKKTCIATETFNFLVVLQTWFCKQTNGSETFIVVDHLKTGRGTFLRWLIIAIRLIFTMSYYKLIIQPFVINDIDERNFFNYDQKNTDTLLFLTFEWNLPLLSSSLSKISGFSYFCLIFLYFTCVSMFAI
jgi:hypothetical protein